MTYSAKCTPNYERSDLECDSVDVIQNRIDWENADIDLYQSMLSKLLEQNFDIWNSPENLQILATVIPKSFIHAAELAAPQKEHKKPNYKVFKSENWRKAEISAKKASSAWVKAGKPRNVNNVLFDAKKTTNITLRGAINAHNNEASSKENNTLMEANFRDPKHFSKLVNRKKSNNSGYTTMLKFDNNEFRGDAQVLSGFFKYHESKASPPEVFKSEENHSYYFSTIDVEAISYIV